MTERNHPNELAESRSASLMPSDVPGSAMTLYEPLEGGESESELRGGGRTLSIGALLRYKWTMLLVTVVSAPLLVGGVWLAMVPEYRARALVHVRSKLHHLVEAPEDGRGGPWGQYDRYMLSQVQIIKSSVVLERLKDREDVRATEWYAEDASLFDELLGESSDPYARLDNELEANPVRNTELIELSMATRNPRDAATIVNALVQEYVGFVGDEFSEEDHKLLLELQEDERDLASDIAFSERAASEARRKLGTGSSADELILQQRVRVDQLQGEIAELDLQIHVREQELADVEAAAASGESSDEGITSLAYIEDPEWQRLDIAMKEAEQRLAAASEQFGEKHPIRIERKRELDFAKERLSNRERVIDQLVAAGVPLGGGAEGDERSGNSVATLQQEIRRLDTRRQLVQQTLDRLTQEYAADFEAAETLRAESTKIARLNERLQQVHQRQRELLEKGRVPPAIKVIASATPPTQPDNAQKRVKMALAALFGALALGIGSAYLRFRFDPRVAEVEEVHRSVSGPFLGYLPLMARNEGQSVFMNASQVEAMRVVRTALLNRLRKPDRNVVQITSASQGSGKSTVSILLARSLAQLGKRVLLVDADIRRPTLARHFSMSNEHGLITLLRNGDGHVNGTILKTDLEQLDVLPAGESVGLDDHELLANGKFSSMLNRWRREYDITIVDGPPLWGTADAAILSRQVDGTLMVVREGHCRRTTLMSSLSVFESSGGKLLGTVFVGTRQQGQYGYGAYGYGAESTTSISVRDAAPEGNAEHN